MVEIANQYSDILVSFQLELNSQARLISVLVSQAVIHRKNEYNYQSLERIQLCLTHRIYQTHSISMSNSHDTIKNLTSTDEFLSALRRKYQIQFPHLGNYLPKIEVMEQNTKPKQDHQKCAKLFENHFSQSDFNYSFHKNQATNGLP